MKRPCEGTPALGLAEGSRSGDRRSACRAGQVKPFRRTLATRRKRCKHLLVIDGSTRFTKSLVDCLLWTVQAALTGGSVLTRGCCREGDSVSSRRAMLQGTAAVAGLAPVQASGLVN